MQQVSERLDKLVSKIREIQRPHMNGSQPADVLLVGLSFLLPLQIPLFSLLSDPSTISKPPGSQVAHGLILRGFVKRWLNFSIDAHLPMILDPGAVSVLRCVINFRIPSGSLSEAKPLF